ncbi:MAG: hypothetical protein O3A46_15265 [Candidatus Poribacteria bacterium]|nr:hypothetical protein [Candidatus Poribacteria bacterium]
MSRTIIIMLIVGLVPAASLGGIIGAFFGGEPFMFSYAESQPIPFAPGATGDPIYWTLFVSVFLAVELGFGLIGRRIAKRAETEEEGFLGRLMEEREKAQHPNDPSE